MVRSQITHLNTGGTSGCLEVGCRERLQWDTGNNNDIWCFGHTGHFMGIYVYQNSSNSVQLIMLIDNYTRVKMSEKREGARQRTQQALASKGKGEPWL